MDRLTLPQAFSRFRKAELEQLKTGPMWAGAANQPIGYGDSDLERLEAAGLLLRTERGFVLTTVGRTALSDIDGSDAG